MEAGRPPNHLVSLVATQRHGVLDLRDDIARLEPAIKDRHDDKRKQRGTHQPPITTIASGRCTSDPVP